MLCKEYNLPFRHWQIWNLVPPAMIEAAADSAPPEDWPHWVRYDNDCERRKLTCRDRRYLPEPWTALLDKLLSMAGRLSEVCGLPLEPDATLHGGGLHVTLPGGWLQPHLDYALHPVTGKERRLNLILFMNRRWEKTWGGTVDLYDDSLEHMIGVIPEFGKALAWEPGDREYHGTGDVSPLADPRVTAAVYYVAKARPTAVRKRALFVPRRAK